MMILKKASGLSRLVPEVQIHTLRCHPSFQTNRCRMLGYLRRSAEWLRVRSFHRRNLREWRNERSPAKRCRGGSGVHGVRDDGRRSAIQFQILWRRPGIDRSCGHVAFSGPAGISLAQHGEWHFPLRWHALRAVRREEWNPDFLFRRVRRGAGRKSFGRHQLRSLQTNGEPVQTGSDARRHQGHLWFRDPVRWRADLDRDGRGPDVDDLEWGDRAVDARAASATPASRRSCGLRCVCRKKTGLVGLRHRTLRFSGWENPGLWPVSRPRSVFLGSHSQVG